MKTFVTTTLVALSLVSGALALTSNPASAGDFGSKQWWDQQKGG